VVQGWLYLFILQKEYTRAETPNFHSSSRCSPFTPNNLPRLWQVTDRLCGIVVRVPGYRSKGSGFDSRCHSMLNRTHVSSQVAIRSRNVSLQFKPVQMFDGRSNMLRLFGTDSAHTFLNSKCPWLIVSTLNTFATTGYNITHCKMSSSPRRMYPSLTQLLADPEHAVGSRFVCGLQKTYCTKHTHLHVTGSLSPHCAFDLRRISPGLISSFTMSLMTQRCSALGVTRSDGILY
jgi:hypothetical protein